MQGWCLVSATWLGGIVLLFGFRQQNDKAGAQSLGDRSNLQKSWQDGVSRNVALLSAGVWDMPVISMKGLINFRMDENQNSLFICKQNSVTAKALTKKSPNTPNPSSYCVRLGSLLTVKVSTFWHWWNWTWSFTQRAPVYKVIEVSHLLLYFPLQSCLNFLWGIDAV